MTSHHDWDALRRVAAQERSPAAKGPFTPWLCEYRRPDGVFGIVLYGVDPEHVHTANAASFPDLRIIGVWWDTIDPTQPGKDRHD